MMEYACQRIYRDARITSIYEGTTQLQTVAAIRYVTNGSYAATLHEYELIPCAPEVKIPILMIFLFELLFYRSVKIEKKEKKDRDADK
jgi:hypothetical protein